VGLSNTDTLTNSRNMVKQDSMRATLENLFFIMKGKREVGKFSNYENGMHEVFSVSSMETSFSKGAIGGGV